MTFRNVSNTAVEAEIRRSGDCSIFDESLVDIYVFTPTSGKIEIQRQCSFGSCAQMSEPKIKTIYHLIYGSDKTVAHFLGKLDAINSGGNYPAFYLISDPSRYFYNSPGHPLHAVALRWIETVDNETWTIAILKSNPVIAVSTP